MGFSPFMLPRRSIFCTALLFCAAGAARAQVDTRSMSEKFAEPDYNLKYVDPNLNTSFGGKTYQTTTNRFLKPFGFLHAFSMTKEFKAGGYNAPNYWGGNFKFKTTDANLNSHSPLTSLLHMFKTKPEQTKTAWLAEKGYGSREAPLITEKRNVVFRGKIQGKINKEGPAALAGPNPLDITPAGSVHKAIKEANDHPTVIDDSGGLHQMTIQDVRDLLDKTN